MSILKWKGEPIGNFMGDNIEARADDDGVPLYTVTLINRNWRSDLKQRGWSYCVGCYYGAGVRSYKPDIIGWNSTVELAKKRAQRHFDRFYGGSHEP